MNELDQTIKERIHYHNHKTVLKKTYSDRISKYVNKNNISSIFGSYHHIKNVRYSYLIILFPFSFRNPSHNEWQQYKAEDHHRNSIPVNANNLTSAISNTKLCLPVIFNQ